MGDLRFWIVVAIIVAVTALLRFLPFLVFSSDRGVPKIIDKLSRLLPYAVMGMLVVYCLKDMHFQSLSGYLPYIIASFIVGILHVFKRNTLLSIITGTVSYMLMVQYVF